MPVEKFGDLDAARRALWTDSRDPGLPARIRRLWEFSSRLHPRVAPKGVRKFRSIQEANLDRESRESTIRRR